MQVPGTCLGGGSARRPPAGRLVLLANQGQPPIGRGPDLLRPRGIAAVKPCPGENFTARCIPAPDLRNLPALDIQPGPGNDCLAVRTESLEFPDSRRTPPNRSGGPAPDKAGRHGACRQRDRAPAPVREQSDGYLGYLLVSRGLTTVFGPRRLQASTTTRSPGSSPFSITRKPPS
jgi:hypothetical protein